MSSQYVRAFDTEANRRTNSFLSFLGSRQCFRKVEGFVLLKFHIEPAVLESSTRRTVQVVLEVVLEVPAEPNRNSLTGRKIHPNNHPESVFPIPKLFFTYSFRLFSSLAALANCTDNCGDQL